MHHSIRFRDGTPTWLLSVVVASYRFTIRIRRSGNAGCLASPASGVQNQIPGAIAGVLSGGGEHASRLAVQAVSLALLGGGAGDEIPQPVPALLASLVVAACGAAGEPRPAGVAARRPP